MMKVVGKSIIHPLGQELPQKLQDLELEALVIKLREGKIDYNEIEIIFFTHMRLAFSIASRYAKSNPQRSDDFVSESMRGIAYAIYHAPHKLIDNNITPWIAANCHRFCRRFVVIDRLIKIPPSTIHLRKTQGKDLPEHKQVIELNNHPIERIFHSTQFTFNDLKELLDLSIKTKEEFEIIKMRLEGYKFREIGDKFGKTSSWASLQCRGVAERMKELMVSHSD